MKKSVKIYILFAVLLLNAQYLLWGGMKFINGDFWGGSRYIKNQLEIVPKVPSKEIFKVSSFGDEQLAFRYYGYMLQFAGDTFGRVTPLKDYDYSKLYQWWKLLDDVDSKSDLIVNMVAYYFSATQNPKEQVPFVIKFIEEHSDKDPENKWWWYGQAVYLANFRLEDRDLALRIAKKLASLPKELDLPIWTRQLEAFIYEKTGEYQQACDIIINVLDNYGESKLDEGELNFIYHFITERIGAIINAEKSKGRIALSYECRYLVETQKASDLRKRFR
ncbi:MAG: hypothetical protein SFT90_01505 [Rickettsiales bacterium]|nr:hypothetical protein [Rickettsiales bacterium]